MPENKKPVAEFTAVMRKAASAEEMARLTEVFEVGKIFMFRRFRGWMERNAQLNDPDFDEMGHEELCRSLIRSMDEVGVDPCPLASFVEGIREDAGDDVRKFCEWKYRMLEVGAMSENEFGVFAEAVARGTATLAHYARYVNYFLKDGPKVCATEGAKTNGK